MRVSIIFSIESYTYILLLLRTHLLDPRFIFASNRSGQTSRPNSRPRSRLAVASTRTSCYGRNHFPPSFLSSHLSLSLSLFRYLRELVPRLHVAPTYEYQLPMGLPSRAYVLLPNIPNTLPIILPSSDLTSFARLRL